MMANTVWLLSDTFDALCHFIFSNKTKKLQTNKNSKQNKQKTNQPTAKKTVPKKPKPPFLCDFQVEERSLGKNNIYNSKERR